ncbi:hypothetical protein M569_05512 [Genlisea aurea]|uniref:CRAL-TRIO domain-containing protein n=1 Tax=Genlisea aurea TaxID=192259 RepID=S8CPY1_9LAMI|nr:hypothetical protein M569_05512 [Genlisea aurea]
MMMSFGLKKSSSSALTQQDRIDEVRELIGPQPPKLSAFCTDAMISRYLRARSWNVKKAVKMLQSTLKWRSEYKPDEIRWEEVAEEAATGKIYQWNYQDRQGRPVLIMRPRCQNSNSVKAQIKCLVYFMEKAISDLRGGTEQIVWLVDFNGFNLAHVSINASRETAYVLQEHYPERLALAILYDPPKIFQPLWKVSKPFLDSKTVEKVKFVHSDDPNTSNILEEVFEMERLESAFGGKDCSVFEIDKYAERMREYDNNRRED